MRLNMGSDVASKTALAVALVSWFDGLFLAFLGN